MADFDNQLYNASGQGDPGHPGNVEEANEFDYVENTHEANYQHPGPATGHGLFDHGGSATGGLGNQMGIGEEAEIDDMMALEMDIMNAGGDGAHSALKTISVTTFIGFDEEDSNELNIDLNVLFKNNDPKFPPKLVVSHFASFLFLNSRKLVLILY